MVEKLLVVDDQFGIRVLLKEVFQKDGYETFDASNGKTALEIIEQERPNLVLLDMKIPGMDGLEILREMRRQKLDVDVIMMTAYGELEMINEAKSLGAMAHFSKPFDIDEVRTRIRDFFNEKNQ
ncbi:response regulator [Paenalkalicoccus suaedae]|uniref:Response regulator n=1 Tax=Paenalkalicoccus suaedae TaxID=2592382 RepID=A0A859FIX1_9BACI|nr:response regulator [Paenalkalicoccus suaedae]QKS72784.1 response regulator [Paenalkalicoccus suaedae]